MCGYPAPVEGVILAFAALGFFCLVTTAILMWGVRSGEKARKSPRLIRYEQPEATVLQLPFREHVSGPLKMVKHEDLFRPDSTPVESETVQVTKVGYWRPMTAEAVEEHEANQARINAFLDNLPPDR